MDAVGTIASLHRFPVKSMQGEQPDEVVIDADGMVADRTWALRDVETGKLVSAKRPRLWRAMLDCRATADEDGVVVELPNGESFGITDPALPASLGGMLGRDVTVERSTHAQQGIYESDWPEIDGLTLSGEIDLPTNLTGEGRSFVDLGVLHVLTTASLDALAAAAPSSTVDVRRFRPSFVVDTSAHRGFIENDWTGSTLRIGGDVELLVGDPTPRCVMTTVAQDDLPREPEVLQAIAEHNRLDNPLGTFACLGAYASVTTPGTIRVGDQVSIG